MIYAALGHEHFQKGLQIYMDRHKYTNTQTFDLWKAWEETSGKPIAEMMAAWTEQMGYPVIACERGEGPKPKTEGDENQDQEEEAEEALVPGVKLSQKWFLADNSEEAGDAEKVWKVPLLFATSEGYETEVSFMDGPEFFLPLPPTATWAKINAGQFAPFRVKYSDPMLTELAAAVSAAGQAEAASASSSSAESKNLCAEDRIGLLLDTMEMCKSGHYESPGAVLRLLKGFRQEANSNVWVSVKMVIDGLERLVQHTEGSANFRKFVANVVKEPAKQIGWDHEEGDSDLKKQLRGLLIGLSSTYLADDAEVLAEARRRFDAFVEDQDTDLLPDDYKGSVFKIVLKGENCESAWTSLVKIMKDAKTQQAHRLAIFATLGFVNDENLKKQTLEETFEIKMQDFFYPFQGVRLSGKEGAELLYNWMKENWGRIKERIAKASGSLLQSVVGICCPGVTEERALDVEAFFADKQEPSIRRTLKQVVERTRVDARFLGRIVGSEIESEAFWKELSA